MISYPELSAALKDFLGTYIKGQGSSDPERDELWRKGKESDAATLALAVEKLSDPNPEAVMKACLVLGAARHGEAVPVLLEKLSGGNLVVNAGFIWALGEIGDLRAMRPLEQYFARGLMRAAIAEAFAKIGDLDPVSHLALALDESDLRTRLYCMGALATLLGAHAGESALEEYAGLAPRLEQVLANDPFPPIKLLAAASLASLGRAFGEVEIRLLVEATLKAEKLSPMESFFSKRVSRV